MSRSDLVCLVQDDFLRPDRARSPTHPEGKRNIPNITIRLL